MKRAPRLAWLVATMFGIGRAPFAPGTFGSLPGIAIAWALGGVWGGLALPLAAAVAALVGIWAADRVVRALGVEDPGFIVVDETAGQLVALLFLPPTVPVLVAGFVLFRVFDIIKPQPARGLERLPGGIGIVADDLAAGGWALVVLHVVAAVAPSLLGLG